MKTEEQIWQECGDQLVADRIGDDEEPSDEAVKRAAFRVIRFIQADALESAALLYEERQRARGLPAVDAAGIRALKPKETP